MDKSAIKNENMRFAYWPICSANEVDRIQNVKNAKDYLLKLRADTVVDNMRLFRVYRNYAIINENTDWTFENSFNEEHFHSFLNLLDDKTREKCKSVTFGNLFSNDPNGYIFNTEYGPILTISDSLKFFLKFSHIALMDFEGRIPDYVRMNALRIGIRVMLKTETLDFLMDPRGILPEDIAETIYEPVKYQMQFIAGHEFAHYILGHLDSNNTCKKHLFFSISENDEEYQEIKVFNQSQKQEFAADIYSIKIGERMGEEYAKLFQASLVWFGALELYEVICDGMWPKCSWKIMSHPTPEERFFNIIDNSRIPEDVNIKEWLEFWSYIEHMKNELLEDLSLNYDLYEMYGSVYFDAPNTEWRGKELKDCIDYY